MSGLEAARLGDPIAHTNALSGLIAGAVTGVVLAAAVVAVVGTGGVAAVAIGAGIAAAGAGGALSGKYIGELIPTSPTGAIASGAGTVIIGGRPAARAGQDLATCSGATPLMPHGSPVIAQGSSSVIIEGRMAARKADKLVCGAAISDGCASVIIGGETQTVPGLVIASEVPDWLTRTLQAVALGGTLIATAGTAAVFGLGPALGGLFGGLGGGLGLGWLGSKVGWWLGGSELSSRIFEVAFGFVGSVGAGLSGSRLGLRLRGSNASLSEKQQALQRLQELLSHHAQMIQQARGDLLKFRVQFRRLAAQGDTPQSLSELAPRLDELLTTFRRPRLVSGGGRNGTSVSHYIESLDGQFSIRVTHSQMGPNPIGKQWPTIHIYDGPVKGHGRHVYLKDGVTVQDFLSALGVKP